jgi:alpha-amylase/alpha-mannosidase (GH57 family)
LRYLAVHAHLYQPPRDNPWLERIERQPSALPFRDWNERVSDECYERLGGGAVRGPDGRVVAMVNLFGRISFNIGPTLAAWLEAERPEVLADALAGDRAAIERTGHGAALAQPYGHPIMPLAEPREKRLQLAWGLADFQARFGRPAEGLWFPETAVDIPSFEAAADFGLAFTIVAPEQVLRVRPPDHSAWSDVSGQRVPAHRPYRIALPSGRPFTVFVFDGPLSRAAAFGGGLHSGEALLSGFRSALGAIPDGEEGFRLLAADGETFGHHQKAAEEKLAEALVRARMTGLAHVTHLGDLFHRMPAQWEALLAEPSSWSCAHGVGRWERDCGCGAGASAAGWQWGWRTALRAAVATLRDRLFLLVDRRGGALFRDPWAAAEAYGEILVRPPSPERLADFLARHAAPGLDDTGRLRAAALLELIRQVLFSATSCGWFFDDVSGLEATQVMRHAARACELSREVFGIDPEPDFAARLRDAESNVPGMGSGEEVYRRQVLSLARGPADAVALHAAHLLDVQQQGTLTDSAVAAAYGAFAVSETCPPAVTTGEAGQIAIDGEAQVVHLRTGASTTATYRIAGASSTSPLEIAIDGQPVETPSPLVQEALLDLAAERASRRLPALDPAALEELAWIVRRSRELSAPLPSPFPEAVAGGARALLEALLREQTGEPARRVRRLRDALAAARAAGLTPDELADLRPLLDRHLANLARLALWARPGGPREAPRPVTELAEALVAAREATGEAVLNRTRRLLAARPPGVPMSDLVTLAEAAGMSADALKPVDTPVRPYNGDRHDTLA